MTTRAQPWMMGALAALVALAGRGARADDAPPPDAPPEPPADAPAATAVRALVAHVAPHASEAGRPIELEAQIDAPYAEALVVRWRVVGARDWRDATFERSSAGGWFATLPAADPPGVEYYIHGMDAGGVAVEHFASAQAPHVVRVVPALFDRLERADRQRTGGRVHEVSFDVTGHDFGNRNDLRDYFVRAEVGYTHRLFRVLHQVTFGFGSLGGTTPRAGETMPGPDAELDKALRYGYGEARVRVHPSVFFDARAAVGASHAGFRGGARGQVIFGKPWRSSLGIGGEYLGGLGGTGWVRLQWDTAPPLLMGASIVRTDLPGAVVDRAGLYIAYDVSYRIADRVAVRAQLSYGARDGAAHPGGGLGTAFDF